MQKTGVIGLMSGTSLDGVDVAFCNFTFDQKWHYEIIKAETVDYSDEWRKKLQHLPGASALELALTDIEYGRYLGIIINEFLKKCDLNPDLIASHGHTIFHQPEKGLTHQVGKGAEIFAQTSIPVVYDFRSQDVALGGQGAPLVPVGDRLLFEEFDYCLNLGGIANISFESEGRRMAFDICPCNQVLNSIAESEGKTHDKDGAMARAGHVDRKLFEALNAIPFYSLKPPKSLGREWVENLFIPFIRQSNISASDALATCSEHIAFQISETTLKNKDQKMLVTGGGAMNQYLIERLADLSFPQLIIPDKLLVNFKEALAFAFLGLLRWRNEINCLSSVTGAIVDSSTGIIVGK